MDYLFKKTFVFLAWLSPNKTDEKFVEHTKNCKIVVIEF